MARSIPGVPDHWQNFGLCLMFHITLPLLPLGLEVWRTANVTAGSATLFGAEVQDSSRVSRVR